MLKPINLEEKKSYLTLKTNLTLWVVYASSSFKHHIDKEVSDCINLNIEWIELSHFTPDILENKPAPDIVYIEVGDGWAQKVAHVFSTNKHLAGENSTLIVFGEETDTASLKMALRLGASDYFSLTAEFGELYPLLKVTAEDKVAAREMGSLTLFINTKGGAGATTLATNTAIELATYSKGNVLLVDLDTQFSDVADYLNSRPKYSINDVINALGDLDEFSLDGLVYKHSSGLSCLSFSPETREQNHKLASQVSKLLPVLRQYYRHIVIDMSRGIEHTFQQVVSPATHVYLVLQQNITSVKHATDLVRSLEFDYGLKSEQLDLVVNRYEKKAPISLKDIEDTLEEKTVILIPNNFQLAMECANLGNPIVQAKRNSAIKTALADLSHKIEQPEKEKQGWFGKLFS
ncbi:AAA family ATPase [Vibrio panuliri]|uniref:Type II secretion protein n=1 Tax=Vibrio panuliri TaxID=1381081 RepID=A0A1Q9HCP2_9VIBR|nr:AAA family ATPase [Vibrio panuliri]KAB1455222.1 AAA family ATPase [Vibrio panuliri]OLQ87158.1 type II secretion protein [Vibrio panuliri]OLQ90922.1 type II secretion protein [Vibrio panuliri]